MSLRCAKPEGPIPAATALARAITRLAIAKKQVGDQHASKVALERLVAEDVAAAGEGGSVRYCRLERRCQAAASRDRLGRPSARHRRELLPRFPVVDRLDPIIDRVIFRMLRHQLHLTADLRQHLGIAQIRHPMLHRPQPLRAQPLAARRHALLRGAGLCLFWGRGHKRSVTCYAKETQWRLKQREECGKKRNDIRATRDVLMGTVEITTNSKVFYRFLREDGEDFMFVIRNLEKFLDRILHDVEFQQSDDIVEANPRLKRNLKK